MAEDIITSEKDVVSRTARPASSVWIGNPQDTDGNIDLKLFRALVGIDAPSTHDSDRVSKRDGVASSPPLPATVRFRSDNIGLYRHAKNQERRSGIAYLLTSYISNTLFLLQIILAAAFTGLSAYKEASPVTLTTLGAFNTVVAGCLAWQKGHGVPQRYRKAQDQYQALILEIEMTERSFMQVGNDVRPDNSKPNPHTETVRLKKLFETARADQQANYPDLYVSTGATVAKDSKALAEQLESAKAEAAKAQAEFMARVEALVSKVEGKIVARVEGAAGDALKQ